MDIVRLSENTVIILFEQHINHESLERVSRVIRVIKDALNEVIIDIIPSYASIHITFNLLKISGVEFEAALSKVITQAESVIIECKTKKIIEIPVYYGQEVALDLSHIAKKASLSEKEVIEIHASKIYDVYAIGFAPGFAYLGKVDNAIACPRKKTPRKKVMQGSLGVADQQTAIYPTESPGGWQIIGRTPLQLIDYEQDQLTPFSAGDKVKFNPISKKDFISMGGIC